MLAAGPGPLDDTGLTMSRYSLTDLLDDLVGCTDPEELDAIAVEVWRGTAELHLAANRAWSGSSKWLVRELRHLDETAGTDVTGHLRTALHSALSGNVDLLVSIADEVLDHVGGRLWAGLQLAAPPPLDVLAVKGQSSSQ